MTDLLVDNKVELGARCLGRGAVRRIECDVVPDGIGHGPRAQNRGELARVLDRPVLGAKAENRASLFGSDARKLEELSGICEVDSDSVRHGRLLHQTNARTPELYPSVLRETLDRQLSDVADVLDATQTSSHWRKRRATPGIPGAAQPRTTGSLAPGRRMPAGTSRRADPFGMDRWQRGAGFHS